MQLKEDLKVTFLNEEVVIIGKNESFPCSGNKTFYLDDDDKKKIAQLEAKKQKVDMTIRLLLGNEVIYSTQHKKGKKVKLAVIIKYDGKKRKHIMTIKDNSKTVGDSSNASKNEDKVVKDIHEKWLAA